MFAVFNIKLRFVDFYKCSSTDKKWIPAIYIWTLQISSYTLAFHNNTSSKRFFFLNWISKDLCPKTDHWIGLNDISEEKIFVWVGDSTVRSLVIVLIVFTKYWMNIDCRYLVFIYIYIYILLLNIHFMTNTYVHKI